MLEEFVASYDVLKPLLDRERPVVVLHEALDLISTLVAHALCWQRQIFNLGFFFGAGVGDGNLVFYYGLQRELPVLTHLVRRPDLIDPAKREEGRALLERNAAGRLPTMTHIDAERARGQRTAVERLSRVVAVAARPALLRTLGQQMNAVRNARALDRLCHRAPPADPTSCS
jgi:hypothetical protein